ncbi:MAG: HAMP domain-containing histidine kinase [Lachnospiraceae bacterium]|jgi:signal transduction histidine kinase|nr:HAMP domain-containing histidine kinase [Lachnospiraceae bacterium]
MRYGIYLRERLGQLLFLSGVLATIEIFLLTVRASLAIGVYTALCFYGSFFLLIGLEYRRKKVYLGTIRASLDALDKKYLLPEMMGYAENQEQRILKEILQELEKSMADHVNYYKNTEQEYKEYIELWIHEVKTPIATGKLMLDNHPSHLGLQLQEELEKIEDYTEQALFYARSSHVEKDYLIRAVSLKTLVTQAVTHNKRSLIAKKVSLTMEGLETTVYTDEKWLAFILNQLISNSIKYSDKEKLKLSFTGDAGREQICLKIRDNGRGVKSADLDRVFEKGFTGSLGRQASQATGLGLYLCKKLCGRLGHGIQIASTEGEGCEVTLIFPRGSYAEVK